MSVTYRKLVPDHEISEITLCDSYPDILTYPHILTALYNRLMEGCWGDV